MTIADTMDNDVRSADSLEPRRARSVSTSSWRAQLDSFRSRPRQKWRLETPRRTPITKLEVLFVSVAGVLDFIWRVRHSNKFWFVGDFWGFASREGVGVDQLLTDHNGHLNVFNVVVAQLAVEDGFDYWPIWGIIRTLTLTIIALGSWYGMRRLGANAVTSAMALVLIVTFGYDGFYQFWFLNYPIGFLVAIGASLHLAQPPSRRRRWQLGALVSVGCLAGSLGVLTTVSVFLLSLTQKRLRSWIMPTIPPLVLYVLWYRFGRTHGAAGPDLSASDLVSVPIHILNVLVGAVENYIRYEYARAIAIVLVGSLLLRQAARVASSKMTTHEALFALLTGAYVFGIVWSRVLVGAPGSAPRYSWPIVLLLLLWVVPTFESVKKNRLSLAAIALVAILVAVSANRQLDYRAGTYQWFENSHQIAKQKIETSGFLISTGWPIFEDSAFLPGAAGGGSHLTTGQLARYTRNGWDPRPSDDPELVANVKAALLTDIHPRAAAPPVHCEVAASPIRSGQTAYLDGLAGSSIVLEWFDGSNNRIGQVDYSLSVHAGAAVKLAEVEGASVRFQETAVIVHTCRDE